MPHEYENHGIRHWQAEVEGVQLAMAERQSNSRASNHKKDEKIPQNDKGQATVPDTSTERMVVEPWQ